MEAVIYLSSFPFNYIISIMLKDVSSFKSFYFYYYEYYDDLIFLPDKATLLK